MRNIFRILRGRSDENRGRLLSARMHSTNLAFGKALRTLRRARRTTQRDLAVSARLDRSYISLLERGESSPTLATMLAICRGLGISLADMASEVERELAFSHKTLLDDH
ncbi:helix-turn-helix domain-containing protein [Burkholderia multivorans]|uniref:helix-turn-helix domain-containing protein n=2 Tax=Burkholderia multivorans TaxID=87883 RepID=UPI002A91F913|nr:helix-turn-helix transcriptional regulator [Burkholderia multivorans]